MLYAGKQLDNQKNDLASYTCIFDLCGKVERNNKYPDICRVMIPFKYTYMRILNNVLSRASSCLTLSRLLFYFLSTLLLFFPSICILFEITGIHQANSEDSGFYSFDYIYSRWCYILGGDCKCKQSGTERRCRV